MPIPTRSKSVKGSTNEGKSSSLKGPVQQDDAAPKASISSSTIPQAKESRLPVHGRSIPTHTRSQSTYVTASHPAGTSQTTQHISKPNANTPAAAAHARSRSVVSAAVLASVRSDKTPPTQSLLRAPSQVSEPTARSGLVAQPQQNIPLPRREVRGTISAAREFRDTAPAPPNPQKENEIPSRVKDELLQLAVTHCESQKKLHRFELSIEQKIRSSLSAVRAEEATMRLLEQERQRDINVEALRDWLLRTEEVYDFSFCLSEILELNSEQGLYTACIKHFEDWLHQVEQAQQQQNDGIDRRLVEPIDRIWESNISQVAERLRVCDHTLRQLQHVDPEKGSALAWALKQLGALTTSMSLAVAESQSITHAVSMAQKQWVGDAIAELVAEAVQDNAEEVNARVGLWN